MRSTGFGLFLALGIGVGGCGDDSHGSGSSGGSGGSGGTVGNCGMLQCFETPPDPGAKGVLFTTSGEVLALGGYAFPPATPDDPAFVDGWEVKFTHFYATFDHITISASPDTSPSDQSETGAVVAKVDGPFAVDLHKGGPLMGKGGADEQAVAIAALSNQNMNGNLPFDPTVRYAFGFDAVAATTMAKNVNLDANDLVNYQEMMTKGYVVYLIGTATFNGGTSCTVTPANSTFDFSRVPTTVNFALGLKDPTTYKNCQNPDNDPAAPFPGEEHQRGIQVKATASVVAQVTFHTDHSFWESFVHDSPAHFDPFAAHYAGMAAPTAKLEDFVGVGFQPFKDPQNHIVPWRNCVGAAYTPPNNTALSFDTAGIPVNPTGNPAVAIRDFYDYTQYNTSTQGHLNSDGLCYVSRNYPSPP
jgi:hypothetical protein